LDEAAAHLAVAETHAETAPPDRQRRLRVAIASLKLSLATRRGHLAGVAEQARFLAPHRHQAGHEVLRAKASGAGGVERRDGGSG
jgi:LuxR family transcriptional regulator, maltose regulon positive regulatory protein